MAKNKNTKEVDKILEELDEMFEQYYLKYRSIDQPYSTIISKVKIYKNARMRKELMYSIKNKIDSNEAFMSLDFKFWSSLFGILGIIIPLTSNLVLKYISLSNIAKLYIVVGIIVLVLIEVILYVFFILIESRKKSKKSCFYKFVYDILNDEEKYHLR